MKTWKSCTAVITALAALILTTSAFATVLHVPSTYPTIQAGVDAAVDGDTVLLTPGTYIGTGNWTVEIVGKSIALIGEGRATIGGFYIDSLFARGSGIRLTNTGSSGVLIANIFFSTLGLLGTNDTGTIVLIDATARIRKCSSYLTRPDVWALGSSHVEVDSCSINAVFIGDSTSAAPTAVITNSDVPRVEVRNAGEIAIQDCLMFGSQASGILIGNSGDVSISRTTISHSAKHGIRMESFAPALAYKTQGTVQISETVVFANAAAGITDITSDHNVLIDCTLSFDNDSGNFVNVAAADGDSQGNIEADPQFLIPTKWWGLYPLESSPCLPANNSCGTLLGVYQAIDTASTCCWGMTGDLNGDLAQTLTDLTRMINHLFITFTPLSCRAAANTSGDPNCLINLTDITRLVDYLFNTFVPVALCTDFDPTLCD